MTESPPIDRRVAIQRIVAGLGFTLSAPTLAGLLSGCQPAGPAAGLRLLSTRQKTLLDVLTEHILPRTDTPGANDAGVTEFIDWMVADFYPEGDRQRFLDGLAALEAENFLDASSEEQFARLDAMDAAAFPEDTAPGWPEGRPFVVMLKELTLAGFYTSEIGATQELRVNPMGSHRGDIPFAEVGRAWA